MSGAQMQIGKWLVTLLGFRAATSMPEIKQPEKNKIINAINALRLNVTPSMKTPTPIAWDYKLERAVKSALPENRTELFVNSLQYHNTVDFKVDFNLMFLTRQPKFKDYPNVNYVFHDTCNNKVDDVLKIFQYRIGQQNCMDFKKCNPNVFTNFQTCVDKPIPRQEGIACSWAWRYVSPLVDDDLKTIACVRFGRPGPYTPNGQTDSFGCYGDFKTPIDDVPYRIRVKL